MLPKESYSESVHNPTLNFLLFQFLYFNNSGHSRKNVHKATEVDSNTAAPVRKDGIKLLIFITNCLTENSIFKKVK